MKILLAESLGFCMGVRRAVDLVNSTLDKFPGESLYMLGPIIHNRQVVEDFERRGVKTVASTSDIPAGARVIIRAHGVGPRIREDLLERKCTLLDGTCPKVIASQLFVSKYSDQGYHIYIAGDKNHGEVIGLAGYAASLDVIDSPEAAESVKIREPALLLAQTTVKYEEFQAISLALQKRCSSLIIKNSICEATSQRQKALRDLMEQCDAILVIGGKGSANTRRLVLTAETSGKSVWHIETADDIPEQARSFSSIGITAGASTPDDIIQEVVRELS